jgi:hypothetical protein
MLGFIHPIKPKSGNEDTVITMSVSNAAGLLYLGTSDEPDELELVANQSSREIVNRITAKRIGGGSVFGNYSMNSRYLLDFQATQKPVVSSGFTMRLDWNQAHSGAYIGPHYNKEITEEFLEPYSRGQCYLYTNCLACLSDADCAWCDSISRCQSRSNTSVASCEPPEVTNFLGLENGDFLRLTPSSCPVSMLLVEFFFGISPLKFTYILQSIIFGKFRVPGENTISAIFGYLTEFQLK